jgi:prepilin-type N-terminal cleavage/methylation domain-containing protein
MRALNVTPRGGRPVERRARPSRAQGFSLVELAIVLVVVGLLIGAVFQGQSLIEGARVRAVIGQQQDAASAFLGFQDRFRALPGDYADAVASIRGVTRTGDGNGLVEPTSNASETATRTRLESVLVWEHLSRAGFLTGNFAFSGSVVTFDATNPQVPFNLFSRYLDVAYDSWYCNRPDCAPTAAVAPPRHNVKTGNQIPAPVLAEIDRKIDDGRPFTGAFRYSRHTWLTDGDRPPGTGTTQSCTSAANLWLVAGTPSLNCGAAWFL